MNALQPYPDRGHESQHGNLVPAHGLSIVSSSQTVEVQRTIIGFRLLHLPDFLEDHTLVGQTTGERLVELLDRQVQLITNLWKWQSAAFSLRYIYRPEQAGVEIALLARLLSRPQYAQAATRQMAADLMRLAASYGLSLQAVTSLAELTALRVPFANDGTSPAEPTHIVEVRQQEDVVVFPWANGEAYVVYPYWQPAGPFLQPFEALLRHNAPCAINLTIEPTRLQPAEYEALVAAAAIAQTTSDWQRNAHSVESSGRWADPQAAAVARIYAMQLRRLSQPFSIVAQAASTDGFAAVSVAQTLGAAFTARSPHARLDDDLVSSFDVVHPRNQEESHAAARTLHHLILTPWGSSPSDESPGLARLRYLADARGSAALFRFPVAVQGGIAGIEVRQPMPDFEAGSRRTRIGPDEVHLGNFQSGGAVTVKLNALSRHGLIAGLPGGGKTNTCLYLLGQLHDRTVPFMVVEPAKTEYRGLIQQPGFEKLLVFTLGDETTAPFRLNPFELLPGVRVEVHLEALNVAINAALPQFGVLPTIIEEALEEVYALHGWRLTDRGGEGPPRLFPTLAEFYREAVQAVERRGYRGELNDNIQAAVKGRLGSLLRGSKGQMFNCRRSLPLKQLLQQPVVLELDSLNDDAKALTMMFLLILLREYRQTQSREEGESAGLRHVLLIEEAHRIMENVSSVGNSEVAADTRARAVRAITDFLVEMRAYGQGMLIAEQSPEKLAPDAVRNTNLKIGHMLPGRQDRESLASAMIMDEAQERFMGKLRVGQAAVFMTGFEKATFMTVPPYKDGAKFADFLPDEAVRAHMAPFYAQNQRALLPFDGCRFCGDPCRHREVIGPVSRHKEVSRQFHTALLTFDERPEPEHWSENWLSLARVCQSAAAMAGRPHMHEAAYCYLAHEVDFPFTEHMRREFLHAIQALPSGG